MIDYNLTQIKVKDLPKDAITIEDISTVDRIRKETISIYLIFSIGFALPLVNLPSTLIKTYNLEHLTYEVIMMVLLTMILSLIQVYFIYNLMSAITGVKKFTYGTVVDKYSTRTSDTNGHRKTRYRVVVSFDNGTCITSNCNFLTFRTLDTTDKIAVVSYNNLTSECFKSHISETE